MADPLDPPPYATNNGPGSGPPDLQNREWLGRAGITDKLVEGLSRLFAPIGALTGKLNRNEINADVLRRLDSVFGGMTLTPVASDGGYWRGPVVHYRGDGRFTLLAARGKGHFPDANKVITQRDSFDRMRTWTPEVVIKGADGWDKDVTTSGILSTGEIGIASMRRRFNPDTGLVNDYGPPMLYRLDSADVLRESEFPLGATARKTNFHYGPILPFAPGGANARQVWWYDGTFLSRSIINGVTPSPIEVMFRSPTGQNISEPAIIFLNAYPGDRRGYMIINNQKAPEYTPYFIRTLDGDNWIDLAPLAFPIGRAPPYLYARPDRPGVHVLQARSSNFAPLNLNPEFIGTMCEMPVDAELFFNSRGAEGFGAWRPSFAMGGWVQGMGAFQYDGPDNTMYGVLTEGERAYSADGANTSLQGSPNRIVTFDNLPGSQMTEQATRAAISSDEGRIVNLNPKFAVATRGRAKTTFNARRIGPDGFGLMRGGAVTGAFSEILPDGKGGFVWEITREPGNQGLESFFITIVLRGEELRKLRGKSVFFSYSALALQDFSEAIGLRTTVFSAPVYSPVTGTDSSVPSQIVVSPARFFPLRKDEYRVFGSAYPVPEDSEVYIIRTNWNPLGTAGARDGVRFSHMAVHVGTDHRLNYDEPIDITRERCRARVWTSYDTDVVPGTANSAGLHRARSSGTAADAAQIRFDFGRDMEDVPTVIVASPKSGIGARIYDVTGDTDRSSKSIQSRRFCVVSNANAISNSGDLFSAEILAEALPWATIPSIA